jgi:thiosulfate reductase/polysulfide reductase chain A
MAEEVKIGMCGLCGMHCRISLRVKDGELVGVESPWGKGSAIGKLLAGTIASCPRANAAKEYLYHPSRLNFPLKRLGERGENRWQRISWDQALDEIAQKLAEIRSSYGAEALVIEANGEHNCAEEFRARFQHLFGTPNYAGHQPVCFGAFTVLGLLVSGFVIGMAPLRPETRCLMLVGINPAVSYPQIWRLLRSFQKEGLKLIVADPRWSEAAAVADIWLQHRPGTDAALLLGMTNVIITEELYDRDFVSRWCHGFEQLVQRVQDYPPEMVADITWVPADKIREAARLYATTKPAQIRHGMGMEEIPNATPAHHARCILPAITGNLDVPGGETLESGHPGILPLAEIELCDKLPRAQKEKMIGQQFKISTWDTYDKIRENMKKVTARPLPVYWLAIVANAPSVLHAIVEGKPYPIKAVITEATNTLLTFPNAKLVYEALKNVDLHVAMDVFMTPTCQIADYVLPAASPLEKPGLFGGEYMHGIDGGVAAVDPLYERKPEFFLWRELGVRLGQEAYWPWQTLEEAFDYRLAPLGVTFKQFIEEKHGHNSLPLEYKKYEKAGFGTPTGKFELYSTALEEAGYDPLPWYEEPSSSPINSPEIAKKFPLILITGRKVRRVYHSQFHQVESIRKRHPDPLVQINPSKAAELGINNGDWVWIETPVGRSKFKCEYFQGIAPQVIYAEFGWWFPEQPEGEPSLSGLWQSNINAVIPDICDEASGTWVLRGIMCKVYRAED